MLLPSGGVLFLVQLLLEEDAKISFRLLNLM